MKKNYSIEEFFVADMGEIINVYKYLFGNISRLLIYLKHINDNTNIIVIIISLNIFLMQWVR